MYKTLYHWKYLSPLHMTNFTETVKLPRAPCSSGTKVVVQQSLVVAEVNMRTILNTITIVRLASLPVIKTFLVSVPCVMHLPVHQWPLSFTFNVIVSDPYGVSGQVHFWGDERSDFTVFSVHERLIKEFKINVMFYFITEMIVFLKVYF